MSRQDANDDDASRDRTDETWKFDRRRALQLGGIGIAGFGLLGGGAGVASAATDCADGPFERAYTGGSVVFSEIPSPEGPGGQGEGGTNAMAIHSAYSEPLTEAEREAVKRLGEPSDAQRAEGRTANADRARTKRPEATENGIEIGAEYDGINAEGTRGGVPSDSQIATGTEYNLHAVNQQVAMFEKQSGDLDLQVRLEDIWDPVIEVPNGGFVSGEPFVFDPRARYDRNEDRYILAAVQSVVGIDADGNPITPEEIEENAGGPGSDGGEGEGEDSGPKQPFQRDPKGFFLVAVSATSDPTGKWYVYKLPPEDADGPDNTGLVDYPQLGFDTDAVYLSQNFFSSTDDGFLFEGVSIVSLDKAQLYRGDPVKAYHFDNLENPTDDYLDFTIQPAAQPFSGGSDGTYYFMNSVFPLTAETPLATTLTQWELTDPTDDPTLRCFTVEVDPYTGPPPAAQPDSEKLIDTLGRRLMNVDYNAETGSLWAAHAVAVSWDGVTIKSAIRWYEVDASRRSRVQSGTYGEPEESYFIPTINSDGDSTMIVHNVSGPNTFPRMDAAGRTRDFSLNVLEDAVVVEDGETRYDYGEGFDVMRWGDYNGVSVDPETGNYWGVSQYSPDINIDPARETRDPYHTRIAELSFGQDEDGTNTGTNVLTIRGTGSPAEYVFSVTDDLEKSTENGANVNSNDAIRRGYVGDGVVGISADSYTFDGALETIAIDGDAEVSLNGNRVTDDEIADMPDNVIEVAGTGNVAEYAFAAADGDDPLEKVTANNANVNGNDEVWRTTANGVVGVSKDAYGFDGTIDSLNVDGDAEVYVNGRPVDPDDVRDHVVTIVGSGERATYDITVGSDLAKSTANFGSLNGNDEVSGDSASGVVGIGSDSFVFNGGIATFAATGDLTAYVDGERIDR